MLSKTLVFPLALLAAFPLFTQTPNNPPKDQQSPQKLAPEKPPTAIPEGEKPAAEEPIARQVQVLQGYKSYVGSLAFSPNGKFLGTASNDRIKVWYTPTWKGSQSFVSATGPVNAVAFSPNGAQFAAATMGRIIIWKTANWQQARVMEWNEEPAARPASDKTRPKPPAKSSAAAKPSAATKAQAEAAAPEKVGLNVMCLAYSPDSALIAAGSSHTGDVEVWDAGTGKELRTLKKHAFGLTGVAFSHDGKRLATVDSEGRIVIWHTDSWTAARQYTHDGGATSVAFSPSGKQIATGGRSGTGKIWSVTTNSSVTLARHAEAVRAVAYSPDGKTLVFGSEDGTVSVWNPATHDKVGTLTGLDAVFAVAFSPADGTMATGAWDLTVRTWAFAKPDISKAAGG